MPFILRPYAEPPYTAPSGKRLDWPKAATDLLFEVWSSLRWDLHQDAYTSSPTKEELQDSGA